MIHLPGLITPWTAFLEKLMHHVLKYSFIGIKISKWNVVKNIALYHELPIIYNNMHTVVMMIYARILD